MIKKLFYLVLIVAVGVLIWGAFAIWTGLYSVYSFPPSKQLPEGRTLIVSRDPGEPMFNSPDYKPPEKKPAESKSGGIGFAPTPKRKTPLEQRTIVELPYIEWAYKKSLEMENGE